MGVKLMVEVLDHAPEKLTPRERYVLVVLAENARDSTRICWPGIEDDESFIRRSRLGRSERYNVIKSLIDKGALERARRGQKGIRAEYRIAAMPPAAAAEVPVQGPENPDAETQPAGEVRVLGTRTLSVSQGPENPDAENPDADAQGPGLAHSGSGFSPFRVRKTRTPSPQSPQPPQGGVGGGDPQPTRQRTAATENFAQPSLVPTRSLKLTEAEQTVFSSLKWVEKYDDVTHDEARAVTKAVRARYGSKVNINYLRKIGSSEGGGFGGFLGDIRSQRAKQVTQKIQELTETEPACEHGSPAGRVAHPVHGEPLCPLCRRGTPAVVDSTGSTDAPVASAIDEYRRAYLASFNAAPTSSLLIMVTQQATAFVGRGADPDQLADLARRAGRNGEVLVTTATRKETA